MKMQNFTDLKEVSKNAELWRIEQDFYKGSLKEADFLRILMLAELGQSLMKNLK